MLRLQPTAIFEAFWSTKPGGMGIGLALCKSIMTAHGGDLKVVNRAQGGAAFCATLPLQAAA
jgi:two-component system sensor kinase FixL